MRLRALMLTALAGLMLTCGGAPQEYDLILRNGTLYDGSGEAPRQGDLAIQGDRIAALGDLGHAIAVAEIDVEGLAVAPGFINMLSWATESLIVDGRSMSNLKQGVTLEVMGEGVSMGPLNPAMKEEMRLRQADLQYEIEWTTLGEYLQYLETRGVAPNVASFVGATSVRIHEIGYEDRPPSDDELERMKDLVGQAMEEGAMGVGAALIYAPAFYASTEELIELCKAAAQHGGSYITHMRSEGDSILEALHETLRISRESGAPAEIYHLKAAGRSNWETLDEVIRALEEARGEGVQVRANMYTYTAGATGLSASIPPWAHEGGHPALEERLRDPATRRRIARQMRAPGGDWENLYHAAGSPDNLLLVGFKSDALKPLTGKTLAQVAEQRGKSAEETAMDLIIEDGSRVGTVYFLMSEDNVRKKIRLPWITFGSDAASLAAEGDFLKSSTHPRAYGNFARLLGRYVRDENVISLQEAIRRLTSLPAANLKIKDRGRLQSGYFADLAVFDPETVADRATFESPHQYAVGMKHVFVNGRQVLRDGEHTGAMPGRFVRGPGWKEADPVEQ